MKKVFPFIKSPLILPLVVGLILRLVLMPITLHPDLWGHSFVAYFFAYKGVFNIYDYLISLPANHPLVANFGVGDIFIYPPLTYLTLGFFRLLVKPFSDANFIPWLWTNLSNVHSYHNLPFELFLFKLPYLFFDIGTGFILSRLFTDQVKQKRAFWLWMVNPVTLYATFMVGQFDILPTFFTVLSLFFISKKRFSLAMVSLGIGGAYKMFPLLFIIPIACLIGKDLKQEVIYVLTGFLPFILSIVYFLPSPAFRSMVLFNPKSQKMLYMSFPVSGAEGIYPFIFVLIFLYLRSFYLKIRTNHLFYILAILLLIFSVTHYHPQWFIWVTPFLIWEMVENNFRYWLLQLIFFASWLSLTLFFEPSLSIGLFNPVFPQLDKAPGLTDILSHYTDVFQLKSLIRSVFAGSAFFYCWRLFSPETNRD